MTDDFTTKVTAVRDALQSIREQDEHVDLLRTDLAAAEEDLAGRRARLATARDELFSAYPELAPQTAPASPVIALEADENAGVPAGLMEFREMDAPPEG